MKISIFGLGYVGCVSLGCLAKSGNDVIGIDISEEKVNLINQGIPTIIEDKIDYLIKDGYEKGRISAVLDYQFAVNNSDVSFICVGTPSTQSGHLNLDYVFNTAKQIGEAIKTKKEFHLIVIRSTVLPGTNSGYCEIIEKISGKKRNVDFSVVSNPEFLREGSAVDDFFNPPITLLGSDNLKAIEIMKNIYSNINSNFEVVDIKIAEIIKYVNNSYHALKIVFANEIGNICKKLNIDSHEVMRVFCLDKHLNISDKYFKPGFAYGGSCLPKDLKGLQTISHDYYLNTPLINSINISNEEQTKNAIELVTKYKKNRIGILGLSFKAGTDDLRYSPSVDLTESLLGKGFYIKVYDKNLKILNIVGVNKTFIQGKLPHLNNLLTNSIEEVLNWADIIVITYNDTEFCSAVYKDEQIVIDLVKTTFSKNKPKNYEGISW
mgnify:CR=1 FL=1